jgi:Fic family protein
VEHLSINDTPISASDIRSVHALVMQKIDKEFAGKYRNGAVRITGATFLPPHASEVSILISELLDYLDKNPQHLSDLVLAVILHHRFVWIHPFFDGNGRSGRLLLNLFLLRKGFPPAVILKDDRKKYYDALKKADKGDMSKLCLLVFQSIERSLDIYLSSISSNFGTYKPIEDIVEETRIPYNQEYVSLLARRGKINAYKDQGKWFTTEAAVLDYVANRKRNRTGLKHA